MATKASSKDEKFRYYALNASPFKVLFTVCGPLALYQALHQIFSILDTLMAAHVSSGAVSAIASLSQITAMISAIGSGLAVGGSIKISEAYGRGDYDLVNKRTSTLYAITILFGLIIVAVMIPFAVPLLRLLRTPEELIVLGSGYFRVTVFGLVVSFFNTVYIAIERSRGHAKRILVLNMLVFALKLGLSAIFIYVLQSEVVMVAVATLISQLALTLYAAILMPRDEGAFHFSFKAIHFDRVTLFPIFKMSYPVATEKVLFAMGKVIVNSMAGAYGPLTVGALGISNNIGGFTTTLHAGMLDGGSALISQNRGAGKTKRTVSIFYRLLLIDVLIGAIGFAIITFALPDMASIFAHSKNNYDQEFCDMIIAIHRYEMIGYILLGINSAVNALLLGYGYAKLTMILNIVRVFVFRVPVLWYLQKFTELGSEAVGVTMMVSNVSTGILSVLVVIPVLHKIIKEIKKDE